MKMWGSVGPGQGLSLEPHTATLTVATGECSVNTDHNTTQTMLTKPVGRPVREHPPKGTVVCKAKRYDGCQGFFFFNDLFFLYVLLV